MRKLSDEVNTFLNAIERTDLSVLVLGGVSKDAIAACRRCGSVEFYRQLRPFTPVRIADPLGLPGDLDFSNGQFDLVIADDWIERTPRMGWALQEIHRVLKPQGKALISLQLSRRDRNYLHFSSRFISRLWAILRRGLRAVGASRLARSIVTQSTQIASAEELRRLLAEADFNSQVVTCTNSAHSFHLHWLGLGVARSFLVNAEPVSLEALLDSDIFFNGDVDKLPDIASCPVSISAEAPQQGSVKGKCISVLCGEMLPRRAMVLSPHPDDELIGVGGTIMKIIEAGGNVSIVQLTNGRSAIALSGVDEPLRSTIRLDEARRVAGQLGAGIMTWDDTSDATLASTPANVTRLCQAIDKFRPDAIFAPFLMDDHPDHVAANWILGESLRARTGILHELTIYGYEVWSYCPYNTAVDISENIEQKIGLLQHYRTAMRAVDYARRSRLSALRNAWLVSGTKGFMEVFVALKAEEFLAQLGSDSGESELTSIMTDGPERLASKRIRQQEVRG